MEKDGTRKLLNRVGDQCYPVVASALMALRYYILETKKFNNLHKKLEILH